MKAKTCLSVLIVAAVMGLAGCGDDKKDEACTGSGCIGGGGGGGGGGNATAAAIAEAKRLTQETRTIGSADDIDQPADLLDPQVDEIVDITTPARECLASDIGDVGQVLADCYNAFADPNEDDDATYDGPVACSMGSANVTITPATPAGHDTLVATGTVGNLSINLNAVMPRGGSESDNGIGTIEAGIAGTMETVECGTSQLRLTVGEDQTRAGLTIVKVAEPVGNEEDLVADVDEVDLVGRVLIEQLSATPSSIEGEIELGVLRCTSTACGEEEGPVFAPDHILLAVAAAVPGDSAEILVEWNMDNARDFNLEDPLSSTNFVDGTLTVQSVLALEGIQPYDAELTIDLDGASDPAVGEEDGLPFGIATLRLTHGTSFVQFVATNSTTDPSELAALVVTNESGAEMTINEAPDGSANVIGTIRVNGIQVGTIEETDDGDLIIRYVDGTFESLG